MKIVRDWETERAEICACAAGREGLIAESFARLTGRELVLPGSDPAAALWELPAVVVAHGSEDDPLFFYANRAGLTLFEARAKDFAGMASRRSAEPAGRDERASLMARVARDNFVADYSGVRISANGRRFRIEQAIVWNLLDSEGTICGQAAVFDKWMPA